MEKSFQQDGMVWAYGKGMFLFDNITMPIDEKPILTFSFNSLYCEPTLCKKVVNGKDYDLTESEIKEVEDYIAEAKSKPQIVNGVDADGKFLENVERPAVTRVVQTRPPETGFWRLDPNTLFEQWVQVYAVDDQGYMIDSGGVVEDAQIPHIIRTSLPTDRKFYKVSKWKWDFITSQWTDGETYENKIKVIQERRIEGFKEDRQQDVYKIDITYNGHIFDAKYKSLETLSTAIALNIPSIKWYPDNALEPVILSQDDMKALALLIFNEHQKLYKEYFDAKKAVLSTLDEEEIINYDPKAKNGNKEEKAP